MNKQNLIGQRFGRLSVIHEAGRTAGRKSLWLCQCDCGGTTITDTSKLKSGNTRSCGCLHRDVARERHLIHGGKGSRLYNIWKNARQRCRNPKATDFEIYGGRGITFSDVWDDFTVFQEWALASGYRDDLTLDRIDPNGNYEPSNCRWATWEEQRHNQRRTREVMP